MRALLFSTRSRHGRRTPYSLLQAPRTRCPLARQERAICDDCIHCCVRRHPGSAGGSLKSSPSQPQAFRLPAPEQAISTIIYASSAAAAACASGTTSWS
jgi:hypothetical protein